MPRNTSWHIYYIFFCTAQVHTSFSFAAQSFCLLAKCLTHSLSLQPPTKTHISIVLVLRPLPEKIQDYYITILIAPDLIGNPVGDSKLEKKLNYLYQISLKFIWYITWDYFTFCTYAYVNDSSQIYIEPYRFCFYSVGLTIYCSCCDHTINFQIAANSKYTTSWCIL